MKLRIAVAVAVIAAVFHLAPLTQADNATPATTTPAADGSDGGAGDAAPVKPSLPPLPEEADYARARAEREADIVAKAAAKDALEQKLVALKKLSVDHAAKLKERSAAATGDERKKQLDIELAAVLREAAGTDPDFSVKDPDNAPKAFADAIDALETQLKARRDAVAAANTKKSDLEDEIQKRKTKSGSLRLRLEGARIARCKTAYCFGGDGTEYAFEPMLELPIGTTIAIGNGALTRFYNSADLTIQFTAGLRFWMLHDYVSLSMIFAKVVYTGTDTVTVPGSAAEHPTSDIRRLGPTFGLGLFGDMLFIGVGYDQLRNGTGASRDIAYAPGQVLSRAVTFSFGLAPFALIRNVAGAASQ